MLKNKLIKFITSLLLFFFMVAYYFNPSVKVLSVVIIALCLLKFIAVTILEPDSIWEIINNIYCERIAEVLIAIDTVIETHRVRKKV